MASEDAIRAALDFITMTPESPQLLGLGSAEDTAVREMKAWAESDSVVGLGVGQKETSGSLSGTLALKVYVDEKLPAEAVTPTALIPPTAIVPTVDEEIPVDVEAVGRLRPQLYTERVRPILPAYSVGLLGISTGTLGCLVRKRNQDDDALYMLSNNHVFTDGGHGLPGAPIAQPGHDDGGTENDVVAEVTEWIDFDTSSSLGNLCDAAIARVLDPASAEATIPAIGMPAGTELSVARGQRIQKSGRTTGHTSGVIKDVDFRTRISYKSSSGRVIEAGFRDQVLCERYGDEGDSGSIVCNEQGLAIGLHWCGSLSASVFSPIGFVLDLLELELLTG